MEKLTFDQISKGKGFASFSLREEIPAGQEPYISFAYTDYGGSFFDEVVIEYFKKHYPENIAFESTSYFGQNGIIWGIPAAKFEKETDRYLLGFERIEDFYSELEEQKKCDHVGFMKRELLYELGITCDFTQLKEHNQNRLLDALYDNTEFDCDGRTMYTRMDGVYRELKLGDKKFTLDYDAWALRIGQGLLNF